MKNSATSLGVNLEGKKYSYWPIAIFIESELKNLSLPEKASEIKNANKIKIGFYRDAWQVTARPQILEKELVNSEIKMSGLNKSNWKSMLDDAYDCLDAENNHRGRAIQLVNLVNSGPKEMQVSPHLRIFTKTWSSTPNTQEEATSMVSSSFDALKDIHNFVVSSSSML
jgi:hypothetical protein